MVSSLNSLHEILGLNFITTDVQKKKKKKKNNVMGLNPKMTCIFRWRVMEGKRKKEFFFFFFEFRDFVKCLKS